MPTACAAAEANLDILERDGLVARVAALEPVLDTAVRRLAALPLVGEIRTVGLTAAVAIKPDRLAADPGIPARAVGRGVEPWDRHARPSRPRPAHLPGLRDH